jgi:plastocyanin
MTSGRSHVTEEPGTEAGITQAGGIAGGRWLLALLCLIGGALLLTSCSGSQAAGDGESRQVLVDYVHDEVASSFLLYFPRNITLHPGDTAEFRQEWTGEPHSVTMGTMVDEMMRVVGPLMEEYGTQEEEPPPEVLEQFEAAMALLPWMWDEDPSQVNQNAAQPCYLEEGGPPEDSATPCAEEDQVQPAFDGTQSYYNSGFIPYEGPGGNQFIVELADDIEPGVYNYYCNLHGPLMAGTITVVDEDEPIPSAEDVARQTREEIEAAARPLVSAYERAESGELRELFGQPLNPPLAGLMPEDLSVHAFISEFIPETVRVPAGEQVSWTFVGYHTVSFQVPSYFSQMTVEDDGTVIFNPDAVQPVNGPGYPEPPEPPPEGEEAAAPQAETEPPQAETEAPADAEPGPPEPVVVDAGEWDGEEFISSGVFNDGTYSITFTEPGTYPYACLIHPQMVGAVVVE